MNADIDDIRRIFKIQDLVAGAGTQAEAKSAQAQLEREYKKFPGIRSQIRRIKKIIDDGPPVTPAEEWMGGQEEEDVPLPAWAQAILMGIQEGSQGARGLAAAVESARQNIEGLIEVPVKSREAAFSVSLRAGELRLVVRARTRDLAVPAFLSHVCQEVGSAVRKTLRRQRR